MPETFSKKDTVAEVSLERRTAVVQLNSTDGTNKLALRTIVAIAAVLEDLGAKAVSGEIDGLVFSGNDKFFSAGADLNEISALTAPAALEFSRAGQRMMSMVDHFPAPTIAAVRGYCMGGGMDLALACNFRIAAPNAVFGHRGASVGLITGWGGTQRLPRLVGKSQALRMFLTAAMVSAQEALELGLVDEIADDPVGRAMEKVRRITHGPSTPFAP